jgi:hypothetical protein
MIGTKNYGTSNYREKKKTDNTMVKRKRQTTQWPKEKDRQHNGQKKKTDNTMVKRKRQTTQWPRGPATLCNKFQTHKRGSLNQTVYRDRTENFL